MPNTAADKAILSSTGTIRRRSTSETKLSASFVEYLCSKTLRTSQSTNAGTTIRDWSRKYCAKLSALESAVMYSSQPEESITIESEAVGVVTVDILPLHAFRRSSQAFQSPRRM